MTFLKTASAAFIALSLSATGVLAVDIQKVTSKQGITALLVEDYTVPLIAMSFTFKGGATQDATGKEGTAELMATMLDEGAADLSSQQLQEALDDAGLNYSFNAGQDTFSGSAQTIVDDSAEGFDLLRKMLVEPRFDTEPTERMKASLSNNLRQQETDPNAIAGKAMRELVYGDHPYGRPSSGTLETVATLQPDDLKSYHKRVFARDNLIIGVVGAIAPEDLIDMLDTVFGDLPEKAQLTPVPDITVETGEDRHIELDTPQTSITLALPGIKRDDEDFFAAYLMNYVLGGGSFSSRLYDEVREKRGLAYGVGTYLSLNDHSGLLGGGSATQADRAQQTVDIILAEVKRMADDGPTQEELDNAKAYITGSYAISNLDTSSKIASVLVAIQESDLGIDYMDRRAGYVADVTLDDVKRMAKELLTADPSVVTVGRPLEAAAN